MSLPVTLDMETLQPDPPGCNASAELIEELRRIHEEAQARLRQHMDRAPTLYEEEVVRMLARKWLVDLRDLGVLPLLKPPQQRLERLVLLLEELAA